MLYYYFQDVRLIKSRAQLHLKNYNDIDIEDNTFYPRHNNLVRFESYDPLFKKIASIFRRLRFQSTDQHGGWLSGLYHTERLL